MSAEQFVHRLVEFIRANEGAELPIGRPSAVPLVAGILHMPYLGFQIAIVLSAFIWAAVLLAPVLRRAGFIVH